MSDVIILKLTRDRIVQSDVFRDIVNKDLLYNVYRDGVWGSYRHLPLDTGKSCLVVLSLPTTTVSCTMRKPVLQIPTRSKQTRLYTTTEDGLRL